MLQFKSQADLAQLSPEDPAYETVKTQVNYLITAYDSPDHPYVADDYGWVILIQEGDEDRPLLELWNDSNDKLENLMWEGAYKDGNYIIAILICTDDFGLSFCIPDAPWIKGRLRKVLNEILD